MAASRPATAAAATAQSTDLNNLRPLRQPLLYSYVGLMRRLPDPELSLRDAGDFIFDSAICRRALRQPHPACLAVFLRELIAGIHRLTVSCHLPEFTDHGLGHLCSLVDRTSRWSSPATGAIPALIVNGLNEEECAVLLVSSLIHDIGMLSQRPEDLPPGSSNAAAKPIRDVPTWVRRTHIERMEGVVRRMLTGTEFLSLVSDATIARALTVAKAHGTWPWHWHAAAFAGRDAGLAAALAVVDLLDEDSARCDSATLLRHRYGTAENCAHWIRHGLTLGRVLVEQGRVSVRLGRPPGSDAQLDPIFVALRNHFLLVRLYLSELAQIGAGLHGVDFDPPSGGPSAFAEQLDGWEQLPGFHTQSALAFHLLGSFMPEALMDERRVSQETLKKLAAQGLSPIDLTDFYNVRGSREPRMPVEQGFLALLHT